LVSRKRISLKLLHNVEVYLARAEYDLSHMLALPKGIGIDWLERSAWGEILHRRNCLRVFESYFRGSQNKRLAIVTLLLSSQEVEVIRGHGYLGELEVNVGTCQVVVGAIHWIIDLRIDVLQESLNVAGRMLRACSIETVRQEKNETTLSKPFCL
jgi:hypothetical protein